MISFVFLKDHSSCCMERGLQQGHWESCRQSLPQLLIPLVGPMLHTPLLNDPTTQQSSEEDQDQVHPERHLPSCQLVKNSSSGDSHTDPLPIPVS